MSHRDFDREIPPDEQLREVSLILMKAMFRLRQEGPRPRASPVAETPIAPTPTASAPRRPKKTLPKPHHAKQKPGTYANQMRNIFRKRKPQKAIFWRDQVVSIQNVPCDQLERAVHYTHQAILNLEFREAFDHAIRTISPEERRIADLVAEHDITYAAREMGVSWRQIANSLARMRAVFEKAGFDPVARSMPHHSTQ